MASNQEVTSAERRAVGVSISELLHVKQRDIGTEQQSLFKRFEKMDVCQHQCSAAQELSITNSTSIAEELIAANTLDADTYYREVANDMGIEFVAFIDPQTILSDMNNEAMERGGVPQIFGRGENGMSLLYAAPDPRAETLMTELIKRSPQQKQRIRICAPNTISAVIDIRKSQARLDWALNYLAKNNPNLSAKQVLVPWQAYFLGVFCVGLPVALYANFLMTSALIHVISTLLFLSVVGIRMRVLSALQTRQSADTSPCPNHYPKYSVLVALHKEEAVAAQLVRAMSALDWPTSRLEVLYVCEEDDNGTIEALLALGLPKNHRVVRVPACEPRTKPKALNFALGVCSGEYVVIYDAEDRPHPLQLIEAWSKFANADHTLACVQAPLVVTNAKASWFSAMFAFEYAAHFNGLLPYLAHAKVPLPLGGTSNHFRKATLEKVGGWDPYNVTEDADLGLRFYRFGYVCDVITSPTYEDAPEAFKEWLPQRTRWQKGWMQTFLVHNRRVSELASHLGTKGMLHFEIVIAGFILSPLLFAFSLISALHSLYVWHPVEILITLVDAGLICAGYFCTILTGFKCIKFTTRKAKLIIALTLPAYWLLLTLAAWRGVFQLVVKPHLWEKTPHRPTVNMNLINIDLL